jgi:hypothetical protein
MFSTQTAIIRAANWTASKGNKVEYYYFAGIDPRNPSGNSDNIESIVYKNGNGETEYTVYYYWDAADRMIKEAAQ